ncbi:MAG: putative deacylase [Cognaticolwellia sp.]|jgi:predicted deacylase
MPQKAPPTPVGWREWVRMPDLSDAWVKAKVDTGARSSSLHAFALETFEREGVEWVRFDLHPKQRSAKGSESVEAQVVDTRSVKNSSGLSESQPVIRTTLALGNTRRSIEVTLTRRDDMGFRMLIGRQALRGAFSVEPHRSFITGLPPTADRRAAFLVGKVSVDAGARMQVSLPISNLASGTQVSLPLLVVHGQAEGPTIWLSAAIHGDEINGVEIIRRVLEKLNPKTLRGTVIAVPVVNVHGFVNGDRYLPDRRDLNRSFPGSSNGSLARRIAHMLMTEVVARCSLGIDLHTGSDGRTNLPQIRADLEDPETRRLAKAFTAPFMMHAKPKEKTLRIAAAAVGARVLLFEGGEALRFDKNSITVGTAGVLRVLAELDMIDALHPPGHTQFYGEGSRWVRASRSGLAQMDCEIGDQVEAGAVLGRIHDSFGKRLSTLKCPSSGLVIGIKLEPLVNRGDALIHIANAQPEAPA